MEYVTLGKSDLRVSRICMGGCPMGQYGWGDVQEKELLDAISVAIDNGVNFFDTADVYGMGTSEQTLAKGLGNRRSDVVIATKFGVRVENGRTFYDNSAEWIRKAVEGSLKRLNTDYIDLYQIHYRDGVTPLADVVESLLQLQQQGLIRHFGLSNVFEKDFQEIAKLKDYFVSFQDEYSLACRKNEADIQHLAQELSLTPLTWGSLGQGVLTGKYTAETEFGNNDRRSRDIYVNFHGEKFRQNLRIVEAMRPIAAAHGKSIAAVAIRFIMDYLPSSVVLCGAKRPDQIQGNIQGADWQLTASEIDILNSVSL
ncbi:MAG: aldo/keto reductase [Akkermansia sp.]|nr:aldo/keto reductase [Akkermansia sp.]